jgi:D-glycero-D-manno-heptose 1,7-bisphosphate phosphatase
MRRKRAVFLDRDGVLIEDVNLLTRPDQIQILPGVVEALRRIERAGYQSVIVTNQTVVARGLIDEATLGAIHQQLSARLAELGAPPIAEYYVCPHHPHADVPEYRMDCECRKPKPGLLHRAADELGVALGESFFIGDRPSDIAAGNAAGCTTVLVATGAHEAPPIVGMEGEAPEPDHRFGTLLEATEALLSGAT